MDISNDTPQDVKYKVSGGGSPVGPHGRFILSEDTSDWAVLGAGKVVSLTMSSKGPWRICFAIDEEGFIAESTSDNDLIHLVPSGDSFRTDVRRVAHAAHRPADHARPA